MPKRIDMNIEKEVVHLYITKTNNGWMGCNAIADVFDISPASVQNILKRSGIKTRNAVEAHADGKQCKPIKNIPVGSAPICKCGCDNPVIWNRRKNQWNAFIDGHYRKEHLYKNADWLKSQYESGRTLIDIGNQFGVFASTV